MNKTDKQELNPFMTFMAKCAAIIWVLYLTTLCILGLLFTPLGNCILLFILLLIVLSSCWVIGWFIKEKFFTNKTDNKLTEELKIIHYQLLLTSKRFKNCNSDFVQELNKTFAKTMLQGGIEKAQKEGEKDIDQTIKFYEENFKDLLIDICIEKIEDEPNLNDYISCLEQECEKARLFVQKALNKYDNGVSSFWEQLAEHADNDYFHEVSFMFYLEHYALAQGFMLDAWRKDKKGDNSYLYPDKI